MNAAARNKGTRAPAMPFPLPYFAHAYALPMGHITPRMVSLAMRVFEMRACEGRVPSPTYVKVLG